MPTAKDTLGLNKGEFTKKIDSIIKNFRCNSKLIGKSKEFVLRSCALSGRWSKMALDPETSVYIRNIEIANSGRKVKMLSLERGGTRQPVPKSKLLDELYPAKRIATSATPEQKHYNAVRTAMRNGINHQIREFREGSSFPVTCRITERKLLKGSRVDVDHWGKPFAQIADEFLERVGKRYIDIVLVGPPSSKRFKDSELWEDWQEYHLNNCFLTIVCASANRSKGADGYKTPSYLIGSYESEDEEEISLNF
jgi:hypothetical protein